MTNDSGSADWPQPAPAPAAPPPGGDAGATIHSIFLGPNGIRAGWRLLIFIAIFAVIAAGIQFVLLHIPYFKHLHDAAQGKTQTMSPRGILFGEGFTVLSLFIVVFFMALIEKRTFADYGLPGREAFGKRFWAGLPYGFAMLSLLLGGIGALHGFSLGGMDISAAQAWKYGIAYAIGFLLVGFFEEFSFRGYMQSTLASGIGFWPAAILLSIVFGGIHLGNPGEAKFGALMAGSFGLLAAFSLQRTGSIWFAIGMHASWDWAETFFYSVPDSGILARGHLLSSSFHGKAWLTGGSVGPEGSLLAFVVLILGAIGIHFLFPAHDAKSQPAAGS